MPPSTAHVPSPQHRYGLVTLTALVVTGMIGSGVFTTSGFALDSLGSPRGVLAAWAVAGLIATCGAVAFGALAVRMPESGGEYLYLSRTVHPFAGFLAGIVSLTAGFSGSVALAALACERYLGPLLSLPSWLPPHAVAASVVLICGIGHATASSFAVRANTLIVLVKITAISTLIAFGYRALAGQANETAAGAAALSTVSLGSFASTVMWISFSYAGFNQAVYVASEARNPQQTVPAALLTGTVLTTVIYLLLNDVFLRSADVPALAGRPEVAAVAAAALGGPTFEWWMRLAIGVSTFSAVAGMMMAGPRVSASMAADGVFPQFFTGPHGISRAAVLQTVLALFLISQASILDLLSYLGVTLSLFSAFAVVTLWLPHPTSSNGPPQQRSQTVLWAAGIYVVATLVFVVLMSLHEPRHMLGTLATVAVGVMIWPLLRVRR